MKYRIYALLIVLVCIVLYMMLQYVIMKRKLRKHI